LLQKFNAHISQNQGVGNRPFDAPILENGKRFRKGLVMRKLLLAAVAVTALSSGYATAQQFYAAPLDSSRVDSRDRIVADDAAGISGSSGPQDYSRLSDRDLQRRSNEVAAQQQQLRAEQQAIADETARRTHH
jgi:hypothetical protein